MKSEISIALLKKDITYIKKGIDDVNSSLDCMVKNDDEYKEIKTKVDSLWDDRNRLIGWLFGVGFISSGFTLLANNLIKVIEAHF